VNLHFLGHGNNLKWVLNSETDLFSNVAWAGERFTGGKYTDELASDGNDKTIFSGIGGCGIENVTSNKMSHLKGTKEIVKLHMEALGTFCIPEMQQRVMDLIDEDFLRETSVGTLYVHNDSGLT